MFIGHAAAGYLTGKGLLPHVGKTKIHTHWLLTFSIIGAIAPDLDLFYFYLFDHRQHHHHTYFTHFPVFWLVLLLVSIIWLAVRRNFPSILALAFSLNGFIHLLLDSIVGDIWWLMPWVDKSYALFHIPRTYHPWWLNFILHWSFAAEVVLVVTACVVWRKSAINVRSLGKI